MPPKREKVQVQALVESKPSVGDLSDDEFQIEDDFGSMPPSPNNVERDVSMMIDCIVIIEMREDVRLSKTE